MEMETREFGKKVIEELAEVLAHELPIFSLQQRFAARGRGGLCRQSDSRYFRPAGCNARS